MELAQILRYDLKLSTTYHLQMDRETEQVNQEIEMYCCTHSARHGTLFLFFLFLFLPLTFAFVLTAVAVLCKPGCAVSAADTSSV